MKKIIFALISGLFILQAAVAGGATERGAEAPAKADTVRKSGPFKVYLKNDEYKIYMRLNLYGKDIRVPGQDVFGLLDGYIGSSQGSGLWLITASKLKGERTAEIDVINDYGSEDFTATLHVNPDGTYTMKKNGGSTLKFGVRGKWQKLPGTVVFKK